MVVNTSITTCTTISAPSNTRLTADTSNSGHQFELSLTVPSRRVPTVQQT